MILNASGVYLGKNFWAKPKAVSDKTPVKFEVEFEV
jgi:hypothetical protein